MEIIKTFVPTIKHRLAKLDENNLALFFGDNSEEAALIFNIGRQSVFVTGALGGQGTIDVEGPNSVLYYGPIRTCVVLGTLSQLTAIEKVCQLFVDNKIALR